MIVILEAVYKNLEACYKTGVILSLICVFRQFFTYTHDKSLEYTKEISLGNNTFKKENQKEIGTGIRDNVEKVIITKTIRISIFGIKKIPHSNKI